MKNGFNEWSAEGADQMEIGEREIHKAELRRLIRNLGMKYSAAKHKSHHQNDPFSIYHFAQAMAYEEAIEIVKKTFSEDMREEDWI